jgi:peptide/nickel transport system substrate-binding protein
MENRFSIKDFFLFLLLGVLIVIVVIAMVQYDRQYALVNRTFEETRTLSEEVNRIKRSLADLESGGLAVAPTTRTSADGAAGGLERGAGRDGNTDPFYQLAEAERTEGYARGDWFVDNFGTKIGRITPLVSSDIYSTWVEYLVCEGLAQRDPYTLEFIPRLARGWQISEDGLEMTFHLRTNANFSDGTPLTADDVIFTFDWTMNPEVQADRTRSYLTELEKWEKIDDHTVKFTFKEPYFLNFTQITTISILPRHFYEKYSPTQFNEHVGLLMGSGPYMVQEGPDGWTPGNGVTLVRNPRYWGEPAPLDRIVFREIEEETAMAVSFRNQETDLIRCPPELFDKLSKDAEVMDFAKDIKHASPYKGYIYVAWNQVRSRSGQQPQSTFFSDKRVRQAMTMLLDRNRLNEEVFLGQYTVADGPFDPTGPQSNPAIEPWPYDVTRARQLLEECGFTDRDGDGIVEDAQGRPFTFTLTYPSGSETWEKVTKFMVTAYARGGIKMEPERLDWPVLVTRLNAKDFDAITLGWSSVPESDPYQIFHSSQIEGLGDNRSSYRNPDLDKAIDEARKTMDTEARMKLWNEVHRILHEDQPYTFLFNRPNLWLMNQRVHNVEQSKVGLNWEPLNPGGIVPWFIPQNMQKFSR